MLSVLVPAYNQAQFLEQAILSVINQNCPVPIQVLVCDDCSTDTTVDVVEKLQKQFANLTLIKSPRNRGVSATRNAALDAMDSETEFVIFLDADDVMVEGSIERDVSRLIEAPNCEFTYGQFIVVPSSALEGKAIEVGSWKKIRSVSLTAGVYRVELVARVGRLNEDIDFYEDTDYLIRMIEIANAYIAHEDLVFYYRRHERNASNDASGMQRGLMRAIYFHLQRRKKNPELRGLNGVFKVPDRETMKKIMSV